MAVDAKTDGEAPATWVRVALGLNFAAWEVQPMGQFGRRKPQGPAAL
jgi:hypothetical protein